MERTIDHAPYPGWLDCEWRRDPCGLLSCPICSATLRRGSDSSDAMRQYGIDHEMTDITEILNEAKALVQHIAEREGVDLSNVQDVHTPPTPDQVPLVKKLSMWRGRVAHLYDDQSTSAGYWRGTEAAADLIWYAGTLTAKAYRQYINTWGTDTYRDEHTEHDRVYTDHVLEEVIRILDCSLSELSACADDPASFQKIQKELRRYVPHIQALSE